MFKIIGRILLILLAAGMVAGGTYLLMNSSSGQSFLQNMPGEGHGRGERFEAPPADGSFVPDAGGALDGEALSGRGFEGRGMEGRVDFSGGLVGIAESLLLITLITAGVNLARSGIGWLRRLRKPANQIA